MKILLASILLCAPFLHAANKIPNPLIDYAQFQKIAREVAPIREGRRVTEEQFAALADDPPKIQNASDEKKELALV